MDEMTNERINALKREVRELDDQVQGLRKRKANGDDVEEIVKKVADIESEMRAKFGSLQSQSGEIQHSIRTLIASVESLRDDVSHQKREVNNLQDSQKVSTWSRIPMWSWVLMAIGLFALLQLGLERYAELKGVL